MYIIILIVRYVMLINSMKVKITARESGADLCGIASAASFRHMPAECRPQDIYSKCKSIVVYAKRMLPESMHAESCIPYTNLCNILSRQLDEIGIQICEKLEDMGMASVAIPSGDPFGYGHKDGGYAQGSLSLRHAGYQAGLGVIGRNNLLINMKLGNIIQLGAVLVDTELEPDRPAEYGICPPDCRICADACPAHALDGPSVNYSLCRAQSLCRNERGFELYKCNICRKVCPYYAGIKVK